MEEEILKALVSFYNKLIDNCPEAVNKVVQSAIDFYGKDNVELTAINIDTLTEREFWKEVINYLSIKKFIEVFGDENDVLCDSDVGTIGDLDYYQEDFDDEDYDQILDSISYEALIRSDKFPLYCITIRFEDITISNELNQSTKIEEIFSRVVLGYTGKLLDFPFWLRTKFSKLHYDSNYCHSHLNISPNNNYFEQPCLGDGPIVKTIRSLNNDNSLDLWNLFWAELDLCIKTESLEGGPYKKLQNISGKPIRYFYDYNKNIQLGGLFDFHLKACRDIIKEVILYKSLPIIFRENSFYIALSDFDLLLLLSNAAIALVNSNHSCMGLIVDDMLKPYTINENKQICTIPNSQVPTPDVTEKLFTFNGEEIYKEIVSDDYEKVKVYYLLSEYYYKYIKCLLLAYINRLYATKRSLID